ncbi:MAG: enoyl-CoA hydratase/isomerase family protein [Deltaproteobacteria bacterium]|nr:enoyl-CoA hydratase/isomerase family protein [Deltaproteobacteria bacterium]
MQGPARIIKSNRIANYKNMGPLFKWADDRAYLVIDKVTFNEKVGAILCYHNPPVHQIGTTGLHAFHDGLDVVFEKKDELQFLILCGANAPVHSGGDLKESLSRLKKSLEAKREMESAGASKEEIDRLFNWGESRLEKGSLLYRKIRSAAQCMRIVGVCGGGLRFGGSAEIPLMADYLIGDSRSGMCFSEALMGIIPGWGGITRVLVKSGLTNAAYMAKTAKPVFASELKAIGIYNAIVEIPFGLPKIQNTGDPASDKKKYLEALEDHDDRTGALLLPAGLEWATCPEEEIPSVSERDRKTLAEPDEIALEVTRRVDPDHYAHLCGKPLRDVKHEIAPLGRPLAPQSIDAIDYLLGNYDASTFDEERFIHKELRADAALYRDPRFLEGLSALLEQRVPDFRHPMRSLKR